MKLEHTQVEVKDTLLSSQYQVSKTELTLCVLKKSPKFLSKLIQSLPEAAKAPLKKELEAAFEKNEFSIHKHGFSEGGAIFILAVPSTKHSVFEFHTQIRKAFSAKLSSLDSSQNISGLLLLDGGVGAATSACEALVYLTKIAHWSPMKFGKVAQEKKKSLHFKLNIVSESGRKLNSTQKAKSVSILAEANNLVKTLADLPGNELNPEHYIKHIKNLAKQYGLTVDFYDRARLEKEKAGAFLAVIQADPNFKGGIIKLSYKGTKKKEIDLALVGKGLCFDTGGYNIKTGSFMTNMHRDMTGSAVALAGIISFAELKSKKNVDAWLAVAENHISPTAFKVNDVVVACDGTSIEVVDTDAEGRMVLADTLALARRTKPKLCVDFATLTGSCLRALGRKRSGVFSNRAQLAKKAVEAGDVSGERLWAFPIGEDYKEDLKSSIADLLQCAHVANSDLIYASTFLSHFIGDETPWVHVDLSAQEHEGGLGLVPSKTTGFGLRWLHHFAN